MGNDPHILLDRLSDYVRPYPAKTLARLLGCTPKTAEHFRDGTSWPNARHWRLIVQAFGRDALDAVFGPDIDATVARLAREEQDLVGKLHDLRARRAAAQGPVSGHPQRRATDDPDEPLGPENLDLFGGGR
jgi:hypothetical protein